MAFHPYLFFGGNCRQAFTRYQQIFGGELVLLTAKEVPDAAPVAPDRDDLIMHAALMIDGNLLMGSDEPTTEGFGPVQGMQVHYTSADTADAERVFQALTESGQITAPIGPTSWSPMFGMCVDRFGTPWMIGADSRP